jgi:hypothetical protein
MSEPAHFDSSSPPADAEMARFMAWRLKFKRALETIELGTVPPLWRDHVRAYQGAWQRATQDRDPDPRTTARNAVRRWLQGNPG